MANYMFVFTLKTKSELRQDDVIFDAEGNALGKILDVKSNSDNSSGIYFYDIESTEDIFEKIKIGDIKLVGIKDYEITKCHTLYMLKPKYQ